MSFYDKFFEKYKEVIDKQSVPDDIIKKYEPILPKPIIDIWRNHGWGGYKDGLFWTINPDQYMKFIKKWVVLDYEKVYPIMRTAFGDLIIIYRFNKDDIDYNDLFIAVIDVKHHDADTVTTLGLEDFFEVGLIKNGRLINSSKIDHDLFYELVNKFGVLKYDQCYGFEPILPLGGKEKIKNAKVFNFDVHLEILTQALKEPIEF